MAMDLGEQNLAESAKECAKDAACPDFVSGLFELYNYSAYEIVG